MRELFSLYKFVQGRRYSTIAGTLVYFLLMSAAPFLLWLALLLGGTVDVSGFISHEAFAAVEPVISSLQSSARSAAGSAGAILIVSSLWSSTNFFYHLRRSGEIIYNCDERKGGLRLRLSALALVLSSIVLLALAAAVPFMGSRLLKAVMPVPLADTITLIFITMSAFALAYALNAFACPYRLNFESSAGGALLTVILWLIFAYGFTVYLKLANPQKLYGAVAAVVVFLIWCYLMVSCLVVGIIYNARYSGYAIGESAKNKGPALLGRSL